MENAIISVLDSTAISISSAARDHGIPVTTLKTGCEAEFSMEPIQVQSPT